MRICIYGASSTLIDPKYIEETETIEKEEIDYNDLTVKELKVILEQKGLSTKGKKAELIQRLKEN